MVELVMSIEDAFPELIVDPKIEIYIVVKEIKGIELSGVGKQNKVERKNATLANRRAF